MAEKKCIQRSGPVYVLLLLILLPILPAQADEEDLLNTRIDTLGALTTEPNIYLDFKIAPAWTLGPGIRLRYHEYDADNHNFTSDSDYDRLTIQLRSNWFPHGAYATGLYLGGSLDANIAHLKGNDGSGNNVTATATNGRLSGFVGQAWFWQNFNMMLGAGGHIFLGGDLNVMVPAPNGTSPRTGMPGTEAAFEFSLGWTI